MVSQHQFTVALSARCVHQQMLPGKKTHLCQGKINAVLDED